MYTTFRLHVCPAHYLRNGNEPVLHRVDDCAFHRACAYLFGLWRRHRFPTVIEYVIPGRYTLTLRETKCVCLGRLEDCSALDFATQEPGEI